MTGIPCRGNLIKSAAIILGFVLGLAPFCATRGQAPFSDDFNDGNDSGWTRYDVLKDFGFPGTYSFPGGNSYSVESPQNYSVEPIGQGRVGAIVTAPNTTYTDFRVTHDVTDWNDGREYVFGPIARTQQPGLGTTDGYLLLLHATDHDFALYRVENEDPGDAIGGVETIDMPPDRDFRIVFTGLGTQLSGMVYDRANLQTPLGAFTVDVAGANPYTTGQTGVIVAQADGPDDPAPPPGAPYAATFDNYRVTAPTAGEWNALSGGKGSDTFNWVGNVTPQGVGEHAKFLGAAEVDAEVNIDSVLTFYTLGKMTFDNAHKYKLTGEPITLQNNVAAELNVLSGSHEIANPVTLQSNVKFTGPGTLTVSTPLDWMGKSIEVASGDLRLAEIHQGDLHVTGGAASLVPSGGTSVLSNLSISGGATPAGKLDITNNPAIIDYNGASPVDSVREQIIAGRGGPGLGKPWNGNGITSSRVQSDVAASPNSTSVAYAENSALPLRVYTEFHGQPVDTTAVLLAYTRTGDANLDGVVNNDDVSVVGANYAPGLPKPFWALGDFDYNGSVDNDDITLLGAFYNPDAPPLAVPIFGLAAVPEPATVLLSIVGATILIVRRRLAKRWVRTP